MGRRSALLIPGLLLASTIHAFDAKDIDLKVGGYVDEGRFQLKDHSTNGEIVNRMGAKWNLDQPINDNWSAMAKIHWLFWRNQATDIALFHIAGIKFDSDLEGALTYENGVNRFKFGLYEFKYNPESKDLGEYLLRSEAYPTIIENAQGKDLLAYSMSRVAGAEYGLNFTHFKNTLLLYAEQYSMPVNDMNIAYLGSVGSKAINFGYGVEYARFLKFGKKINNNILDSALRAYVVDNRLTAKAWKFDLRFNLDIGALIGMEDNFKFYTETALLGTKSDTLYYKNISDRMPTMAGFEVPTFGMLNMLSFEFEMFRNPYHERKYYIKDANGSDFSTLPALNNDEYQAGNLPKIHSDDFKWSIFAHKALSKWVDLKLRLASDHLRLLNWDGDYESGQPMTSTGKNWYFLARIEFHN